jgi:hypothetical protein
MKRASICCIVRSLTEGIGIRNELIRLGLRGEEIAVISNSHEILHENGSENIKALELLSALGMPQNEAKRYQRKIDLGYTLICVCNETDRQINKAEALFQRESVDDISITIEAAIIA